MSFLQQERRKKNKGRGYPGPPTEGSLPPPPQQSPALAQRQLLVAPGNWRAINPPAWSYQHSPAQLPSSPRPCSFWDFSQAKCTFSFIFLKAKITCHEGKGPRNPSLALAKALSFFPSFLSTLPIAPLEHPHSFLHPPQAPGTHRTLWSISEPITLQQIRKTTQGKTSQKWRVEVMASQEDGMEVADLSSPTSIPPTHQRLPSRGAQTPK